jgi:NAD(P)-dependent dehydrogenase (short-subunit alcohol dehydrogenase family)
VSLPTMRVGHTPGAETATRCGGPSEAAVASALGEPHPCGDVTNSDDAEQAVRAAVDRSGRIDVLVNNAGNFYAGYFEELAPEQIERQLATNLIGPMNVARTVLPVMRKQRSGHIVSISSGGGLVGFEFCSAYAASKFGLEGWMESLEPEAAPFGIHTTIVDLANFRTEILTRKSATTPSRPSRTTPTARRSRCGCGSSRAASSLATPLSSRRRWWRSPARSRRRFIAGADALALAEREVAALQEAISASRDLSTSLAVDEVEAAGDWS